MEVACGDDRGLVPAVNKSVKTGPAGAVLEDTDWVGDGFAIFPVDEVRALLDQEDGDIDGDEARSLKVRCARTRCLRLVLAGGVESPLIFAHAW